MLRILTLGSLAVTREGVPVTTVASRRKPLALLALLAVAGDRGMSRDKLMAYFWPDADIELARTALRQTLYSLRRDLKASDLFVGSSDIRLNPEVITSDVALFEGLLDRNDREAAVALYAGPFLDGFHLSNAPEFERWQEAGRSRYDAQVRAALQWLAGAAGRSGDHIAAVRWWTRLTELDPANSKAALALAQALVSTGDTMRAARHLQAHVRYVEEEIGGPADASIKALASRLSNESEAARVTELAVVPGVASATSNAEHAAPAAASYTRQAAFGRSWWLAALAVLPAFALWSTVLAVSRHAAVPDHASPVSSDVVAVLPFAVRGATDSVDLGEGISELLSTNLDVAGDIRTADRSAVLNIIRQATDTSAAVMRKTLARSLEVTHVISGEVEEDNGQLSVSAVMWRISPDGRDSVITAISVPGAPSELFNLVDRLTARLLPADRVGLDDRVARLAGRTTESLDALRFFLAGSKALRRAEHARAAALFDHATEIDSTFGLAYYRLAMAAEWNMEYDRARLALERARTHGQRLGETERLMTEALDAYYHGRARQAEQILERILTLRPGDADAWFRLAETRFHFFAVLDHPIQSSRQAWRNVLGADSNHVGAMVHLARIAALEQDSAAMDRIVARVRDASPATDRLWEARALQAFIGGRTAAEHELMAELSAAGDSALVLAFSVSAYTDNIDGARRLATTLASSSNREMRKVALAKLAELEIVAGRPSAADRWLAQLAALDADYALLHRGLFATLPMLVRSAPVLDSLAMALEQSTTLTRRASSAGFLMTGGAMGSFATLPEVFPELRCYVQGRVGARRGRWVDVQKAELCLRALDGPAHARALALDLALSLGALRAVARGDSAGADSLLASRQADIPVELLNSSWFYSQSVEQLERGALARWKGSDDIALETYAAASHSRILAAPAAFAMAEIHEQSGNQSAAIREYRRVLNLWSAAEPDQHPLVEAARARLAEASVRK